jgi:hypothetical protein
MNRADHLRHCALVSLRKRAPLTALLVVLAGVLGFVLGGLEWAVIAGVLTLGVAVSVVVTHSVRRHSDDPEAQTFLSS